MNPLKKLAGQTAIYGVSSILGRLLNYLLVPLHTNIFHPSEYGVVTELYSYTAFFFVLFTYGMETAFFRFYQKKDKNPLVYSTGLRSLLGTTVFLTGLLILLSGTIADGLYYEGNEEYIIFFALILGFDAISALPYAKIRAENRPVRFAAIRLTNIAVNIGLNLFFLVLCPWLLSLNIPDWLETAINAVYYPEFGIGYIFLANFGASAVTFLLQLPELRPVVVGFSKRIYKEMLGYGLPLILVGLAGIANEMLDKVLLKFLLPGSPDENIAEVGIYGAWYKLSILMTMFIQAFRYAAEPFFFSESSKQNSKKTFAMVLTYFVGIGLMIFLGVMLYLDLVKHFIGDRYHNKGGEELVPVLLLANLFLGIYYNLSIWYKLQDKTRLGAIVAIGGAVVTILGLVLLVPAFGILGAAWATFICYSVMAVASYFLGQKYYPIRYPLPKVFGLMAIAIVLFLMAEWMTGAVYDAGSVAYYLVHTLLIGVFFFVFWKWENPLQTLRQQAQEG